MEASQYSLELCRNIVQNLYNDNVLHIKKTVTMSRYLFTSWLTDRFQPIQHNITGKKNLTPPMNNYQNEKQILWQ